MTSGPRPGLRRRGAALGSLGAVVAIAGTFLPWLASGATARNSYQLSGMAARFALAGAGPGQLVLAGWPWLGPLLLLPVMAGALRRWVAAGVLAVLLGAVTTGIGTVVVLLGSGRAAGGISVIRTGPVTLAIGGIMLLVGGGMLLVGRGRRTMVKVN